MNFRDVSDDVLKDAVASSKTIKEVLRKIGVKDHSGNFYGFKSRILQAGIDTSNLVGHRYGNGYKIPMDELFSRTNRSFAGGTLKKRLLKEGIKEHRCEKCENSEWMGTAIPLEAHHVDGDHFNNVIENIQLLCPNCHALTENYRNSSKKKLNPCSVCGEVVCVDTKMCKVCFTEYSKNKARNIPSREQLETDLEDFRYGVWERAGRKYGVSSNAVRKWAKRYKIMFETKARS